MAHPAAIEFLAVKVRDLAAPVVVVGDGIEAGVLLEALVGAGKPFARVEGWEQASATDLAARVTTEAGAPVDGSVVVARWPSSPEEWEKTHALAAALGRRVSTLQELLLPLKLLIDAHRLLPYRYESLAEAISFYSGRRLLGPLDELNRAYPLAGKRVIEFGPMDGYQTAALRGFGASEIVCIEARPENALKTLAAKAAFGWSNVDVAIDDFHGASAGKYGRFDLAFAHGVYYHSFAPLVFLENLFALSDHIFFGGFVADAATPGLEFVGLEANGRRFEVVEHGDGFGWDQGINLKGFYFQEADLLSIFKERGYQIAPLADYQQTATLEQVRYLRFLASKTHA